MLLVEVILPRLTEGIPMNIQHSTPTTPLRARMIADMSGRNLSPASQSSHLRACTRFAAWLGRLPETATPDDVKYFQQHLIESIRLDQVYLFTQSRFALMSAFASLMSFLIRAVRATFGGLPALIMA